MKRKMPSPCMAVLFDMDGVITDTMPYHFRAWKRVLADAGVRATRYEVYRREGQDGMTSVREICAGHGVRVPERTLRAMLKAKETLFKRISRKRFIPGSRALLRRLSKAGMKMALVTGTSRHEMVKILPRELRELFTVIVTGDDVARGKPYPDPFLKALAALHVEPKHSVVVENAPFGITSGRKAGAYCIALQTSLPRRYLREADMVVKGHRSLQGILLNNL